MTLLALSGSSDGGGDCVDSYVVCNNIFNQIMNIAGDINVREHKTPNVIS